MITAARRESNAILRSWCATIPGRVLSIGSSLDQDNEGGRYREYFSNATSYTTSDHGGRAAGCDLAVDVRAMPQIPDGAYDAVFCSGVLEHVDDYQAGVRECRRILSPEGMFLLGLPFRQRIHMTPQDFWRFTKFGVTHLLTSHGFTVDVVVGVDAPDPEFPASYWARARRRP